MRRRPALASALFLAMMPAAVGGVSEATSVGPKEVAIREILQLTGSAALSRQVMEQMLPTLKQAVPDVPDSFWNEFMAEVNEDELIERIVPVYAKHFTLEELEQLIAFYKTPLGKKLIGEMPVVMQESIAVGQEWGRDIAMRALRKAKARQGATGT